MTQGTQLRQRLRDGAALLSTFVKTTSPQIVELLATVGFDALVLDAEHAPFGIESLDLCLMAARASGTPALVRVPNARPDTILQVLDMGAAGVVVPHVDNVEQAREAVRAARYRGGLRGFSASPRAGGYGARGMAEHIQSSDENTLVIVQIESVAAVENAEEIGRVEGVDCLFVGPADLAVSMGCDDPGDPRVQARIADVRAASGRSHCALGCFTASAADAQRLRELGTSLVVLASDQMLLRRAAHDALTLLRGTGG